ncbi:MAG: OmpA family protein [Spirochaetales bacterium]|nr:OmpA family protein [Spirochaetales bacterium]
MRKGIIIGIIILAVVAAAGGTAFYFYSRDALVMRSPLLVQETPIITYLSGEVYFSEKDSQEWFEPEAGQKLKQGTLLRTGIDGEMDIRLSAETLLRMDHDSLMVLEQSTLKNVELTVEDGRVYGRFHKLFSDQDITVNTPTVVAGIRGTDLVFEASQDESTIYALSGITEIINPDFPEEKLLLSFQQKTNVEKGKSPSAPEQMANFEVQEFQKTLNAIHTQTVLLVTRAIQFKANSAEILDSSGPELENLYQQVDKSKHRIRIQGHTADIGYSAAQYTLSLDRAKAIKEYLVEQGISARRLEVEGFGGTKPVADNSTDEGKARNRRVEFVIIE